MATNFRSQTILDFFLTSWIMIRDPVVANPIILVLGLVTISIGNKPAIY